MKNSTRLATTQRFIKTTTKKGKTALFSRPFKYKANLSKFKTYKEWRCIKHKQTKCRARFCGSPDNQWYWKQNPRHTCVNPPEDDLTPDEIATALLESVFSAPPKPTPKTKVVTKAAKQAASYN
jgi:hypothetical protein